MVAVIGPLGSGKTSLIASLYDLFQRGPVMGFGFARSATLQAFEEACHDARATSQRAEPRQERTPLGWLGFYHLGIHQGPGKLMDLIVADRAGEEYRSATDDPNVSDAFVEIRHAESVTVLVDGERLLDSGARHNLRSEIELMLEALIEGNAVVPRQRLALVLTKLDAVQEAADRARVEADFAALIASVRLLFGNSFATVESFRVAASPKSDVLPHGHGVAELLCFWTAAAAPGERIAPPNRLPARAFGRLMTDNT